MTNSQFTKQPTFIEACHFAGVEPTSRQASKYRNRRGIAWIRSRDRLALARWRNQQIINRME